MAKKQKVVSVQFTIPETEPPTPEELAERHQAAEDLRALRDELGPIGMTLEQFLRGDSPEEP